MRNQIFIALAFLLFSGCAYTQDTASKNDWLAEAPKLSPAAGDTDTALSTVGDNGHSHTSPSEPGYHTHSGHH